MDAVIQVDVRETRAAVERRVAGRRSRRGMTRRVGLADIRFDFDDDAAGANAAAIVDEDLADQIARDVQRRAIVKRPRKLHRSVFSRIVARSAAIATCLSGSVRSGATTCTPCGSPDRKMMSATSMRMRGEGSCA